jgi:glutathione S-transferase
MIRVYGSPITRAQRTMWMLEELELPYEQIPAGVPSKLGELASREEIVALNPSGKVPVLVDGDLVLTESYAINLYLAKHYESALTPRNETEWAKVWQWTLWMATEIENDLQRVLVPRRSGFLDQLSEAQRKEDELLMWGLRDRLKTLDRAVASADWLVGGRFTVADLNVASMLALAEPSGVDLGKTPSARAWLARCLARPAARSAWGKVIEDTKQFGFVGDLQITGEG